MEKSGDLITLATLLFSLGILLAINARAAEEREALARMYRDSLYPIGKISLAGVPYAIRGGDVERGGKTVSPAEASVVLRASLVASAFRLDPIFAIEGTDPDSLKKNAGLLEDDWRRHMRRYAPNERGVLGKLYPVSFLGALAEAERERQKLKANPSVEGVLRYGKRLETAIASYRKGLVQTRRAVEKFGVDPAQRATTAYFLEGTASAGDIIRFLEKLDAGAAAQGAKAKSRFSCMEGSVGECAAADRVPPLQETETGKKFSREEIGIPPRVERNIGILLKSQSVSRDPPETLIALDTHRCEPQEEILFVDISGSTAGGANHFGTFLNALNFFTPERHAGENDYFAFFFSRGIPFMYQPGQNQYVCPDAAIDLARSEMAIFVREAVLSTPLADGFLEGPVAAAERVVRKSDPLRAEDVEAYGATLAAAIRRSTGLSVVVLEEALRRIELVREKGPSFDRRIANLVRQNEFFDVAAAVEYTLPPRLVALGRNYAMTTFLSWNATVTGQEEPISFVAPRKDASAIYGTVSEGDLLRSGKSEEEIARSIRDFHTLWNELVVKGKTIYPISDMK